MLNALLFASVVAPSEGHRLIASISNDEEMRPASSDTFEPVLDTGEELAPVENNPFRSNSQKSGQLENLQDSVRTSHIFPSNSRFKIIRSDSIVALSTYKHPLGRELDMKIDTLLVAKEVLKVRKQAAEIDVYFFTPDDQSEYTLIAANLDLVKQFDSGRLSQDEIFDLMRVKRASLNPKLGDLAGSSYDEIASTLRAGEGIMLPERIKLMNEIESMKQLGTNVDNLQAACLLLEDFVRQNDDSGARAAYAYAVEMLEGTRTKRTQ